MTHNSVWSDSVAAPARIPRPTLAGDITTDVLIIGAGLAGVLTADKLRRAGVNCIVTEAKTVGGGITKNTTAKITAQHGLIYADLIESHGRAQAKLYLDANLRAIGAFRTLSEEFPCDFEEKTAYVFTDKNRPKLEREASAYRTIGIAARIVEDPPLPVKTAGALAMEGQAQFNPLKLLLPLSDSLELFENTFVRRIHNSTAFTQSGKITAGHIVLATHYPLINIPGLYFIKLYQHRSYVAALEGAPLPDGMFVDEQQNGYSFRTYKDLLFIGGGDHKTGGKGGGFAELRGLSERAYPGSCVKFAWSTQDCMTLDNRPYIGRHRAGTRNLYVATGFNKWGMTGSMVAAELLSDLIINGSSELEELYSPSRSMLKPRLAANLVSAVTGLLTPGTPRCAHMGCRLRWNDIENTWDCPCHGSRFDTSGHVIDNPAKRGIRR